MLLFKRLYFTEGLAQSNDAMIDRNSVKNTEKSLKNQGVSIADKLTRHIEKLGLVYETEVIDFTSTLHFFDELPDFVKTFLFKVAPSKEIKRIDQLNQILHSLHPPELKSRPKIQPFHFFKGKLYYGSVSYTEEYDKQVTFIKFSNTHLKNLIQVTLYMNAELFNDPSNYVRINHLD